jgi:tRNA G10  N-methylase Trm11
MQYAFILGRVYTLSIAELIEVLQAEGIVFKILVASIEAIVIETEVQIDHEKLQRQLGGVIKIIKIIDLVKKREQDSINFALQNYFKPSKLKKDYFKEYSGKKQFGLSIYLLDQSIKAFGEPRRLGMFIKKGLQDEGASLRACLPDFNSLALASVVVTKNLLLQKGAEICIIAGLDRVYVGKTLVVQDFEDYGRRDYQRPIRDDKQGMIPPKVAQVMINFTQAKKGSTLLDPFCGIGTMIQEGILLGYKVVGSDIAPFAISGSEKNLEWFRNRYKVAPGKYKVEVADVRNVSTTFKDEKIAAIATEGSLGPIYGVLPKPAQMERNFEEIGQLWVDSFKEFKKMLPKGGKVAVCFPAYKVGLETYNYLPQSTVDQILDLGYSIHDHFPEEVKRIAPFLKVTPRNSIIYDRKEQVVAREIVTFINN